MCEVLYNKEYYESLLQMIDHCLKRPVEGEAESPQVLIGTKTFYYGLGGGFWDFQQFVQ